MKTVAENCAAFDVKCASSLIIWAASDPLIRLITIRSLMFKRA